MSFERNQKTYRLQFKSSKTYRQTACRFADIQKTVLMFARLDFIFHDENEDNQLSDYMHNNILVVFAIYFTYRTRE